MKYLILICLCFLAGYPDAEADSIHSFHPCNKAYVGADQIALSDEGISIEMPSGSLLTSALYKDEQGFYFKDFKKRGDCSEGKWECKVCHHCNPNYNLYCGICWK